MDTRKQIYVGDLPSRIRSEDLAEYFGRNFGHVDRVELHRLYAIVVSIH